MVNIFTLGDGWVTSQETPSSKITKELVSRFASSTGDPLILLDLIAEDDAQKRNSAAMG